MKRRKLVAFRVRTILSLMAAGGVALIPLHADTVTTTGPAGNPGGAATATATSATDTTNPSGNTATATGGASTNGTGAAGANGGTATATATTSGPTVTGPNPFANASATGGAGGTGDTTGSSGTAGGTGGAATATGETDSTSSTGLAEAQAAAIGGRGGNASGTGQRGGTGGVGTASATATNSGGGNATINLVDLGGNGGEGLTGANGGNGASQNNIALGSGYTVGGGQLSVVLQVEGGEGGNTDGTTGSAAGNGGNAQSTIQHFGNTVPVSPTEVILSTATGGSGGSSAHGFGGIGGTARAEADALALTNGTATASASGGLPGTGGIATPTGQGASQAMASVILENTGGTANSIAESGGSSNDSSATLSMPTQTSASSRINNIAGVSESYFTSGMAVGLTIAHVQATDGNALPYTKLSQASSEQGFGAVSASPLASDVTTLQMGNANNKAIFQPNGHDSVMAAGVLGAQNTTGLAQTNRVDFTLQLDQTPTSFQLGLIDPTATGKGFDTLTFTLASGDVVITQTFTTLAAAETYFSDNVLTLSGANMAPDIGINLTETSSTMGDGFAFDFEAGEAVPEPSTTGLGFLGFALIGCSMLRRNRSMQKSSAGNFLA